MAEESIETQGMPKLPSLTKIVGKSYATDGNLWADIPQLEHPRMADAYADLLAQQGLLPLADKAEGFTLFSPSANQGIYEYTMAKKVEDSFTKTPEKKPVFIAADVFGTGDGQDFAPGFNNNIFKSEHFNYVAFQKVSAEAQRIPLSDGSVNVVWDRLGALWHTQTARVLLSEVSDQKIQDLLTEYKRVLKPDGCVIIDSGSITRGANGSTIENLEDVKPEYRVKLEKMGWNISQIGSGETQLTVLRPQKTTTVGRKIKNLLNFKAKKIVIILVAYGFLISLKLLALPLLLPELQDLSTSME